jgi:ABC-type dipeptide/oligopeptide/nickel transport system ATPase component
MSLDRHLRVTKIAESKTHPNQLIEYGFTLEAQKEAIFRTGMERYSRPHLARWGSQLVLHDEYHVDPGIVKRLNNLINVNWLSIHRTPTLTTTYEESTYDSTIDKKIKDQSDALVRYFSTLSAQKDEETKRFQEYIFMSILEIVDIPKVLSKQGAAKADEYKTSMRVIFQELNVSDTTANDTITSFFEQVSNLSKRKSPGMPINDFALLLELHRIEGVVDRWKTLQNRSAEIFEPRDKFVEIINRLLQRKTMVVKQSNELNFVTRSEKELTAQMLSSGEKQLLILLSETLLQKGAPSIFIADEPELSLHVTWQEKLIPSMRSLNTQAQIIVATHSPDIVGGLIDRAIDMESLIP